MTIPSKKFIVDALVQQELDWVLEGEHERFTVPMRNGFTPGFRGYANCGKDHLIQLAKDFDLWDSIMDQWGQRCDL